MKLKNENFWPILTLYINFIKKEIQRFEIVTPLLSILFKESKFLIRILDINLPNMLIDIYSYIFINSLHFLNNLRIHQFLDFFSKNFILFELITNPIQLIKIVQ